MTTYYTAISVLLWLALIVLCILVHEDERIDAGDKRMYYATYAAIGLALLAEWTGVRLSGNESIPSWVIRLIKCFDYILTPLAGGALVAQLRIRNRWDKALTWILIANAAFQVVSLFMGWMVTVGDHASYAHGPLYGIYAATYLLIFAIVIVQFLIYGMSFSRQNRLSLYATAAMAVAGILMQELLGNSVRTAYVALTLGATFLYIHAAEFSQQAADARIRWQQRQLTTDALTGLLSRHAYARELEAYAQTQRLPANFVAFSIDANGLKEINDSLGHDAGDELLRGAADCISQCFDSMARCFRTGGDEFVVFAQMSKEQASEMLKKLEQETSAWHGTAVRELSLSAGFAHSVDHEGLNCEELVKEADEAMYLAKAAYYREEGRDRRHVFLGGTE